MPKDIRSAIQQLRKLLDRADELQKSRSEVSPEFSAWESDIKITLNRLYGSKSEEYARFDAIWFSPGVYYDGQPQSEFFEAYQKGMTQARLFLKSRIEDLELQIPEVEQGPANLMPSPRSTKKAFIIHGHDHGIKETVARFLSKIGIEPVILHEQPNEGRTVIEKFEEYAHVPFAIAIFSADDLGVAKAELIKGSQSLKSLLRDRPRQNVIFEFGYFLGKLGRKNVVAILDERIEKLSDYAGVIYIPFDSSDGWRLRLFKELKAAGFEIDANSVF